MACVLGAITTPGPFTSLMSANALPQLILLQLPPPPRCSESKLDILLAPGPLHLLPPQGGVLFLEMTAWPAALPVWRVQL